MHSDGGHHQANYEDGKEHLDLSTCRMNLLALLTLALVSALQLFAKQVRRAVEEWFLSSEDEWLTLAIQTSEKQSRNILLPVAP